MVATRRRGDQQGRRGGRDSDRRAEHARQLSDPLATAATTSSRRICRASRRHGRRVRALRAGLRLRRVRHADARRAARRRWVLNGRKLWITNGAEAADLRRVRERESVGGLQGHHGVRRRAWLHGLQRRQEGGQARHSRVEHDGADSRRRRSSRATTCSARSDRATRSRSRR